MSTNLSPRDWEAISAYLDGQLAPKERARMEERMKARSDLRAAMEDMRRTRAILRSQPKLRAPRNFTLTPEMVGKRVERPPSRSAPLFGLASALASVLFVVVLLADLLGIGRGGAPAMLSEPAGIAQEAPAEMEAAREAAPVVPEAEAEMPVEKEAAVPEAVPASEEALQALEAVRPTLEVERLTEIARMTAAPPGAGEGYPPPQATPGAPDPEVETFAGPPEVTEEADLALEAPQVDQAYPATTVEAEPTVLDGWTSLRLLEVILAAIALGAGLLWFYLRRVNG